jgi:hypothetical protein
VPRVAEGVPTDVLVDAGLLRCRFDVAVLEVVRSVKLFPLHARTGEDSIVVHRGGTDVPPTLKPLFWRRLNLMPD